MSLANRFTVRPIWDGLSAIIIAGGPSLSLAQIRLIARARHAAGSTFRVMAINDAIYPAWFADWLHAADRQWWFEHIQGVHTFPGIKTTLEDDVPEPWVTGYLQNTGQDGFDPDPACCRTGANSAYQAMHISIHAGVRRIILVGVDMKDSAKGDRHWFGDHPAILGTARVQYDKIMIPHFETLAPTLKERGVEVINCSPGSALTIFPAKDLVEALRG